jgi:CRP/FNR family transcriptional regulator, anaerobic regulatory protein
MSSIGCDAFSNKTKYPPSFCHSCLVKNCCLPLGLDKAEVAQLERIIGRHRPLRKGEHLYRAGDPMQHIYAIRTGALKSYYLDQQGNEKISDFHLAGELVGLDAIGADYFRNNAVALDTSTICSISITQLEELAGQLPRIRHRVLNTLSRQIHYEHQHLNNFRQSAERSLASFLLNLSARYGKLGLSTNHVNLPMSRAEIANYLGLTGETISRLLSRFRDDGLINCQGREIHLLNLAALHQPDAIHLLTHYA